MLTRVSWLIPAAIAFGSHAAYAQQACENLVNLKLPYTLITAATGVPVLNATSADLRSFRASGGKLILCAFVTADVCFAGA